MTCPNHRDAGAPDAVKPAAARLEQAFTQCERLVQAGDKDRFIATLFASAEHRAAVFALYAFNLEIARIPEVARGPLAGEVRLRWWSDVLAGTRPAEAEGHPVAAALLATCATYRLAPERLQGLVEAHRCDLYSEPMQTLADLEAYADAVSTGLILLSAQILAGGREPDISEVSHHAGVAYAMVGLLKAFSVHSPRGQLCMPLDVLRRHGAEQHALAGNSASAELKAALAELRLTARQHLDRAGDLVRTLPAALLPALLPVALTPITLARMERGDHDPCAEIEVAPWRRQWTIWRAARRPRRLFADRVWWM